MAADVAVKEEEKQQVNNNDNNNNVLCNVCVQWKGKYVKLEEKRNALRQAVKLLEQQINRILPENLALKKAFEEERARTDNEKKRKDEETVARVALENEICALKSEILVLQKGNTRSNGVLEQVSFLQARIADGEKEIITLKELLQKEKLKADSGRKTAEAEKKKAVEALKAEKNRANKEKMEEKKIQECRLQLDLLKKEADEARSQLAMATSKSEEASKRLEAEKQKAIRERKRADLEKLKADEQRKLMEANDKKIVEEKSQVKHLSQQLEDEKRKTEEFQKKMSELLSSKKLLESNAVLADENVNVKELTKRLEAEKKKVSREKKRADSEKFKAVEVKKLAESDRKNAIEEKNRADRFSHQLEEYKQIIEKLQEELLSSKNSPGLPSVSPDKISSSDILKMKLLREQLKFEKMQVKHAKQVVKLEKSRMSILQQEHTLLKQEFAHFSHRLDFLDQCFSRYTKIEDLSNVQWLNLKKNSLQVMQPLQSARGLVKPMHPLTSPYDLFRQAVEHSAPFPPVSGVKSPESVSGIDLESPAGGSNREMLESSTINSGMTSFSDGQLMASQERGAHSVTTSSDGNPAVVDENSVRSHLGGHVTGRETGHNRKRKRVLSMLDSIKKTSSENKKLSFHMEDKVSLQSMWTGEAKKLEEGKCLVFSDLYTSFDGSRKKRKVSNKKKHVVDGGNKQIIVEQSGELGRLSSSPVSNGTTDSTMNELETLFSFEQAAERDYMKLLELDNPADEECYRTARARPLSPSLPEIRSQHGEANEVENMEQIVEDGFHEGLSYGFHSLDIINDEMSPNTLENTASKALNNSAMLQDGCKLDLCKGQESLEEVFSNASETSLHNIVNCGPDVDAPSTYVSVVEEAKFQCESETKSLHDGDSKYFIVVLDSNGRDSISKTFLATRRSMDLCSLISQSDSAVRKVLQAIATEDLLPKEKVCVFFSMLLVFGVTALKNFGKYTGESNSSLDLLAERIFSAMSDVDTRRLLEESFSFDELLSLIEEFLIDGRILVRTDVSSEASRLSDSRMKILMNDTNITWSFEAASAKQFVAASVILASICSAVHDMSFISEASYNIFLRHRHDSSFVLTILHIFAHVCGSRYFTSDRYILLMTVIKSLVTYIESLHFPAGSCIPSTSKVGLQFPSCSKCPFSEEAISLDFVISLLFEKLQNCFILMTTNQDNAAQDSSDKEALNVVDPSSDLSCLLNKLGMPSTQSVTLCHFINILSLVELVASYMSWDWVCNKVVPKLLELLESCKLEDFSASIIVLLSQLGRLGVSAKGKEDSGVEAMRCEFNVHLCRNSILQNSHCRLTF